MTIYADRLWVGEDIQSGKLWLYDENHQQTFGCDLANQVRLFTPTSDHCDHGSLIAVNRVEHRSRVRTVKDNVCREQVILAYMRWLTSQGFDGIDSTVSSVGHSSILDMRWAGGSQSDRVYISPVFYSDS